MDSVASAFTFITVIVIFTCGAILTLIGHLLFLRQLQSAHPELRRAYHRITCTADHTTYKHYQLRDRVYSRITDRATLRTLRRDLLFQRIFAYSALLSGLSFAACRIIPLLRQ